MNRQDWESQVFDSNMNTTARVIALAIGSFGRWSEDKTVEPGIVKLAQMSGTTRDTVSDCMAAMVEQGWLKPKGVGRYNTTIYELCPVVDDTIGILARVKRKMNPKSLAALKQKPQPVADSIGKSEDSVVADSIDKSEILVADSSEVSCRKESGKLPNRSEEVADSIGMNMNNLYKNMKEHDTPGKPVVVTSPKNEIKEGPEDSTSPKMRRFLSPGEERWFKQYTDSLNLEQETVAEARRMLEHGEGFGRTFEEKLTDTLLTLGVEIVVWDV